LDFVELHLPPTPGLLMVRATPPIAPCPSCGYQKVTWPHWPDGELEVSAASIPKHCDIFRMYDLTTCILCTQRFYDAVKELNASGLDFEEVGVV